MKTDGKENVIKVEHLQKQFQIVKKKSSFFHKKEKTMKVAVDDISFSIAKGEKVAVIGPNGAGKSTTIKMITGIIHPTAGNIQVMGYSPTKDRKKLTYQIGCLFGQKSGLNMHLSARDSYQVVGAMYDMYGKTLQKRIDLLIEMFDAKDIVDVPVKKLSLGQRMRAEIMLSLIHQPKILFLDEPTIGLDIITKQKMLQVIETLNVQEKVTVFLTSHDMSDVERLCDRIIIIDQGKIVLDHQMSELMEKYGKDRVIKATYSHLEQREVPEMVVTQEKENVLAVQVDVKKYKVQEVLKRLGALGNVVDFTIESIALETIIADIYQRNKM